MIFVHNESGKWVEVADTYPSKVHPQVSHPLFETFALTPATLVHQKAFWPHPHQWFGMTAIGGMSYWLFEPQRWFGLQENTWIEFTSFLDLGEPPADYRDQIKKVWRKRFWQDPKDASKVPWGRDQFGYRPFSARIDNVRTKEDTLNFRGAHKYYRVTEKWSRNNSIIIHKQKPNE